MLLPDNAKLIGFICQYDLISLQKVFKQTSALRLQVIVKDDSPHRTPPFQMEDKIPMEEKDI